MTLRATDVMDAAPPTVTPDMTVTALAAFLVEQKIDGACVVEDGELQGVVTAMDLVFQSQPPHLPSFFHFLEALIPLENTAKVEQDLRKIAGATVRDVMSTNVVTAAPDESVATIAEKMVARHLSIVPVVDAAGRLVGAVTKAGILRRAYGLS
jgi:CBS domain-containing protein